MAVDSKPVPSMPTPTIPKRTRLLGESLASIGSGERRTVLAAREAPAAPALVCRNSRRETRKFFMRAISFDVCQQNTLTKRSYCGLAGTGSFASGCCWRYVSRAFCGFGASASLSLLILCHRFCALHPCDAAADKLCPTETTPALRPRDRGQF